MTLARVPHQLALAAFAQLGLLVGLSTLVGLGPVGVFAEIGYAAGLAVLVHRAFHRAGVDVMGPADVVTLARAVLIGGVTALVVDGLDTPQPAGSSAVAALVGLATVALLLDAVDGYVARRSRTASAVGARFDMEVDSFLLLVLSVQVATTVGIWVTIIGLLRYAFVAAGWVLPWLRAPLPTRYSAKTVAALQGIVLVVAASEVLPQNLATALIAVALALLVWSFGRDVRWLWRTAQDVPSHRFGQVLNRAMPIIRWRVLAPGLTVLAGVLVLAVLLTPGKVDQLSLAAFARLPIEALVGLGLLVALPPRARRPAATVGGAVLGLLAVATLFDLGFSAVLGRPFDPVRDWPLLESATDFVRGSLGPTGATVALGTAAVLAVVVPVSLTLAVRRLAKVAAAHRTTTIRAVAVLTTVWVVLAVFSVQVLPGTPLAAATTTGLIVDRVEQVRAGFADRRQFASELAIDNFRDAAHEDLLSELRGKDVVIAFVESYGRVVVEAPEYAPQIGAVLDEGTQQLAAAGFAARSAYLTSPTAGGSSWLAHATFLSGLWIDNEQRHRTLVGSERLTLTGAFRRAGWRTVAVMPGTTETWPEAEFYGHDQVYDYGALDYHGPDLGWATMPDQYTLAAFERLERARGDRAPLLAEIALVSSHAPWVAVPELLDWNEIGDGSVFATMLEPGDRDAIWSQDPATIRATYRGAIEYSLRSLISYVQTYGDDRLVLIILGDHQPAPILTGDNAGRDVPITVITRDRAVLDRFSDWSWHEGLRPGPHAPVWRMDTFRDQFLSAFSTSRLTP